jgi:hypothetical protein
VQPVACCDDAYAGRKYAHGSEKPGSGANAPGASRVVSARNIFLP